jgi:hypothetical protein
MVPRLQHTAFRVAATLALVATPTVAVAASKLPAKTVLRVSVTTGGVVRSGDGRIRCPRRCSAAYKRGAVTELNAYQGRYFDFRGWTGDCFGYVPRCVVAVDRKTGVHARFVRRTGTLVVSVTGAGAIEVEPGGTIIRGTGSASIPVGVPITLTPRPDAGSTLRGWAEGCAHAALEGCTITGSDVAEVAAAFGQTTPGAGPRTLTVDVVGPATVTSTPSGIDCPGTCSAAFHAGTLVALRSSVSSNYYTYWEGGGACNVRSYVPTCLLVLNTSTDVRAFANPNPYLFTVQRVGVTVSGRGAVSGGGISCGRLFGRLNAYCEAGMDPRDHWTIRLSAIPGRHARFGGWGGACQGKRPRCTLSGGSFEVMAYFRRR